MNLTLDEFLLRNNVSQDTWHASQCDWNSLLEIANDHEKNFPGLVQSADFFAKLIQAFPVVHSVRWRVKDPEHLIEKIVRKRADGEEKYKAISLQNYFTIVTDLIGIRALHLFKDDCFAIDQLLTENWQPIETPIAYTRVGDHDDFLRKLQDQGLEIKSHPAGYRSVHYVFASQPLARRVVMEIQVRTIFEEGWSEIDHKVRYPNFSENPLLSYLLTIFNRMAGSADEMGGFVLGLAAALGEFETKMNFAVAEKDRSFTAMESALKELENVKKQDLESKENLSKLKAELEKMKKQSAAALVPGDDIWKTLSDAAIHFANKNKTDPARTELINLKFYHPTKG